MPCMCASVQPRRPLLRSDRSADCSALLNTLLVAVVAGETAYGKFPFKSLDTMTTVARRTELSMLRYQASAAPHGARRPALSCAVWRRRKAVQQPPELFGCDRKFGHTGAHARRLNELPMSCMHGAPPRTPRRARGGLAAPRRRPSTGSSPPTAAPPAPRMRACLRSLLTTPPRYAQPSRCCQSPSTKGLYCVLAQLFARLVARAEDQGSRPQSRRHLVPTGAHPPQLFLQMANTLKCPLIVFSRKGNMPALLSHYR